MTVQEIIDEFERGCSNTVYSGKPEDCPTCVRAFVRALQAQVDLLRLTQSPQATRGKVTIEGVPQEPAEVGGFIGDIYFGDPNNSTRGTHRWDGTSWGKLPTDNETLCELLAKERARLDQDFSNDAIDFLYKHGELTYKASFDAIKLLTDNGFKVIK